MGIIIVTGPLGSGKTTLVKRLTIFYPKIPLIINDLADYNEDADRLKKAKVYSVTAGCVCCTKSNELIDTIKGIKSKQIILETTGVADLGPIIDKFQKNQIPIDLIITLVDSTQVKKTSSFNLKNSDLVVMNKIDLVSPEIVKKTYNFLKANSSGKVVKTIRSNISKNELKKHVHYHIAKGRKYNVSSLTFSSPNNLDKKSLLLLMKKFPRSKGHVLLNGKGYCVDGVYGKIELQKAKTNESTIVLIGKLDNFRKVDFFIKLLFIQKPFYISLKQIWSFIKQLE
jgi:G3E family GTPase